MSETIGQPSSAMLSSLVTGIAAGRPAQSPRGRAIAYSTLSSEAVRQLAICHYGFDSSVKCSFYFRGTNDIYLLSAQDEQFALRLTRSKWRTRHALLGELLALRHLGALGVEVTLPVVRLDGDLITDVRAPEGLRRAVMFRWAGGQAPKFTSETHALQYGKLVARLHNAGDNLPPHKARPRLDLEFLLQRPLELIRPKLATIPGASNGMDSLVERLRARLGAAPELLRDWGFCHGDISSYNARIDGDRLVLFDFDFCGSGWRLLDLACYRLDARRQGLEQAAWIPFIRGYLQLRPSAADSLLLVGSFMILRCLWSAALWVPHSLHMGLGSMPDGLFENLLSFCEAIEYDIDHGS